MSYFCLCGDTHDSIVSKPGYHPDTVTKWIPSFEQLLVLDLFEDEENHRIGGEDIIVHIDNSKFGKWKYHRGHRVEGVWIVGGVEANTAEKRLCYIGREFSPNLTDN